MILFIAVGANIFAFAGCRSGYHFCSATTAYNIIASKTVGYQDSLDFSTLPIPFFCVSTDIVSCKAKYWTSGPLNTAMRSTMSIPVLFEPVRYKDMILTYPSAQSVSQYIAAETQAQIEGLDHIVSSFVSRMNGALNGQFASLGQTLSAINQSQRVDQEALDRAMDAAMHILAAMQETTGVMQSIAARFEDYAGELTDARQDQQSFAERTNDLLASMHAAAQEQTDYINALRAGHDGLQESMRQYADWSGRVLEAVHQQSQDTGLAARQVSDAMRDSGRALSDSYSAFVDGISGGLSRTMGLFEENMHGMVSLLDGKLADIEKTARAAQNNYNMKNEQLSESADSLLQTLSRLQRALSDMTACVSRAAEGVQPPELPAKEG